jgi:hypothetical protein
LTIPENVRRAATAACAAGLLALAVAVGATAAGSARGHVAIYLVQGEQVVRVMRPGASPTDAVEQLVAGPTAAEVKHGMRTYVPTARVCAAWPSRTGSRPSTSAPGSRQDATA